jgi:hypothetical protein
LRNTALVEREKLSMLFNDTTKFYYVLNMVATKIKESLLLSLSENLYLHERG